MQGEPRTEASTPAGAVFLSYASEDAAPAKRICDALRATGIEVWFDQSELRGGDAWDQKIRRELHDCALFIPVISANTAARHEGYFRLEWNLADQRTYMIARNRAFIVPVCVDATSQTGADTPESFQRVQWTRLPAGETPPAFVAHMQRLLSSDTSGAALGARSAIGWRAPTSTWSRRVLALAAAVMVLGSGLYLAINSPWISKPRALAVFAPPRHSIAVLPFVNLSGDQEQEYFSDGLTEELLNSLAQIDDLQVAARTSSFSFKEHPDIAMVARKLNVATVLEGSVRRSEHTLRVTAQLIDAVTGFHLWSSTYDRDLGDVLKLQTEIATAVADALKVTLLRDISQKIELGGTHDPAAFDAYLRGRRIERTAARSEELHRAIAAYTEAIRLDSKYALAFAERSVALSNYAEEFDLPDPIAAHATFDRALTDARTATSLAPELAEGYYALGVALNSGSLEFAQADKAFTRALALAPGNARILAGYSRHAAQNGNAAAAIETGRRAVTLDPLNFHVHRTVGIALLEARQYAQALAAFQTAISLQPDFLRNYILRGETQYAMGAYEAARKSCEMAPADPLGQRCLAMTYQRLGRNRDAEAMLQKLKSTEGDAGAWDYAAIYAQWGDVAKALQWLETAVRLRDASLVGLKREPYFDSLQKEARFQAIVRELNFAQ
ncbi:MAG TPA: TIR domain-containing protein [Steroidobacteraceae bacterium]|nr:TIR domain-containing protein [Steroidobacteraceae bacterium]